MLPVGDGANLVRISSDIYYTRFPGLQCGVAGVTIEENTARVVWHPRSGWRLTNYDDGLFGCVAYAYAVSVTLTRHKTPDIRQKLFAVAGMLRIAYNRPVLTITVLKT